MVREQARLTRREGRAARLGVAGAPHAVPVYPVEKPNGSNEPRPLRRVSGMRGLAVSRCWAAVVTLLPFQHAQSSHKKRLPHRPKEIEAPDLWA